jgi:hypothetical protein
MRQVLQPVASSCKAHCCCEVISSITDTLSSVGSSSTSLLRLCYSGAYADVRLLMQPALVSTANSRVLSLQLTDTAPCAALYMLLLLLLTAYVCNQMGILNYHMARFYTARMVLALDHLHSQVCCHCKYSHTYQMLLLYTQRLQCSSQKRLVLSYHYYCCCCCALSSLYQ